jgi:hypothetical protein
VGGDIDVWIDENGVICLKARNKFNDPVELTEHEALEVGNLLVRLVAQLKSGE